MAVVHYNSYDEMDEATRALFDLIGWDTDTTVNVDIDDSNDDYVEETDEEETGYIPSTARSATAKIVFNGTDITKDISPYLLSLTYTDNEEDETDDLQIKIQDRDGVWLTKWLTEAISPNGASNTASTSSEATESATGGSKYAVNATSGLNMRKGPGMNYSVITALPKGTVVDVTGNDGSWSKVNYNGNEGYMWTSYLTPTADSSTAASSGGADTSSYPTLRFGSQGEYVKIMQNALVTKGQSLPKYGVDGYFGSETQAAVKAFQTSAGISVDGICGPVTWNALLGSGEAETTQGFSISAVIYRNNWNGNSTEELECGEFELDTVDASSPPSEITIKATSLPYTSQIRQTKKSKAWENLSLSQIATQMATSNGISCMYESSYDPVYKYIEQHEESDITFLQRLAHGAGLSLKATNRLLVLFDQQTYEKLGAVMTISRNDGSYEKYKLSTGENETKYASCRVSYTLPNGQLIEAVAKVSDYDEKASNNQQLEIRQKVESVGEALTLAQKYLRLRNKFSKIASFTLEGNPVLVAGNNINLSGFGYWDGKYIIKTAKHTIGSSGYTTTVTMRNVLEAY